MTEESIRSDIWLWRARFFKSRALAAKACLEAYIRLIRKDGTLARLDKASTPLRIGDRLILRVSSITTQIRICSFGLRRGPAPEAQNLYVCENLDS